MKLIINGKTGQEEYVKETPEELVYLANLQKEVAAQELAKAADLKVITDKAAIDPAFAALLKILGV